MSEESRTVQLIGGSPWGFSIQGGADFRAPLKVTKVSPGGKADLAGVQLNDIIKEISDRDCISLRHSEALYLIRTSGTSLSILLQKGGSTPAPYLPPKQLIRSATVPARRSPRKIQPSPDRSPGKSGGEGDGVGGHEWYKAMHRSGGSFSGEDSRYFSSSGEERKVPPGPIKAKPKSVNKPASNGSVPSQKLIPLPEKLTPPPENLTPPDDLSPLTPDDQCSPTDPLNQIPEDLFIPPMSIPNLIQPVTPKQSSDPISAPSGEGGVKKRSSGKKRRELKPPPSDWSVGQYDFTAETKHELSFKKGDKLKLLRTVDKNWLEAQLGTKKGIIPVSFVELTPKVVTQPLNTSPCAVAKFDFTSEESYELGFKKGDKIQIISRVDENWLQGRLENSTGIFPAAFVDIIAPLEVSVPVETIVPVENEIRTRVPTESSPEPIQGDLYRALYAYSPQNSDELSLDVGTEVHVIRKCEDGWYMGYHGITGAFAMGNKFDKIIDGVYQGNMDGAKDKAGLKAAGITHIVSVKDSPIELFPGDFVYLLVDAEDVPGYNLAQHFERCIDFIHGALLSGGTVLTHCMAGISRASTVNCAYLMTASGLPMNEVLKAIRIKREVANPNGGFLKQLSQYERDNLKNQRVRLFQKFPNSDDLTARIETAIRVILKEK
ncbi:Dual specificity phosphatase [Oopsacas minuta]|uniref:Dual specificity phosphatase n=1 Tax=Oopsacas minuta TaxID=111878 RepID=A0AAV7K654_9METZ|nr:Dual specificity phosphatase [Oopsacas minuta]